jgi:hypothetical protein
MQENRKNRKEVRERSENALGSLGLSTFYFTQNRDTRPQGGRVGRLVVWVALAPFLSNSVLE